MAKNQPGHVGHTCVKLGQSNDFGDIHGDVGQRTRNWDCPA